MAEKPAPPRLMEAVVRLLIPPVYREHVLGDLYERYTSPLQYVADATWSVPCVVASRIRRTSDPAVLLLEAFALYVSFLAAGWALGGMMFLEQQSGFVRLAIPTLIGVVALRLAVAYADPRKNTALKPLLDATLAVGIAVLSQAVLWLGEVELLVPRTVLAWGGVASVVLLTALRMLFPPSSDRPRGAT